MTGQFYRKVTIHGHARADSQGHVAVHVLVAERALGKPLATGVEVHHVDGDAQNNSNRNLVICQDRAYHKFLHVRARVIRAGGDPDTERQCDRCQQLKPFTAFNKHRRNKADGLQRYCRQCQSEYSKTYVRPNEAEAA